LKNLQLQVATPVSVRLGVGRADCESIFILIQSFTGEVLTNEKATLPFHPILAFGSPDNLGANAKDD